MAILNYRRTGASDLPLVLFHAMPLDSHEWDPVLAELSGTDAIVVDAPGFGESPAGSEVSAHFGDDRGTMSAYGAGVHEVLEDEGVTRAVFAGNSMGGTLALHMAREYPGLAAGIGVFSSAVDPDDDPAAREGMISQIRSEGAGSVLDTWLDTMILPDDPEELRAALTKEYAAVSDESFAWVQEAMVTRGDGEAALALNIPAFLVRGEFDSWSTREDYEERAARNPRTRYIEIAHAAHYMPLEKPAEVARILKDLLAEAK